MWFLNRNGAEGVGQDKHAEGAPDLPEESRQQASRQLHRSPSPHMLGGAGAAGVCLLTTNHIPQDCLVTELSVMRTVV